MALVLLRQQFAWRAVYIIGWARNGDEGDGGRGRGQCLSYYIAVFLIAGKGL